MSELRYRKHCLVDELAIGECTFHTTETDGQQDWFAVPVNPNGAWNENGPGGKTWGLNRAEQGAWQVSPSINVLNTRDVHPGEHEAPSLWHQTPKIVGVPEGEPWQ